MLDLVSRRETLRADHVAMERFHPHWHALALTGDHISSRPIVFLCDDEIVALPPDAQVIRQALQVFVSKVAADLPRWEKLAAAQPTLAQAISKSTREVVQTGELRVPQNVWNSYCLALEESGLQVMLTDGTYLEGERP